MATNTTHYALKKPASDDFYNIADFNGNADKIDAALYSHESNTNNPHGVTKAQIGLGNVNNTSDADKPISTATQNALDTTNSNLSSTTTALNNHVARTNNPHGVTAAQAGAVPTTRKINSKALSSDVNLTYTDVGAAAASHNHSASNITSGILSPARGGTGYNSMEAAITGLGIARIATGQYVGNGANTAISLTFPFAPKFVGVVKEQGAVSDSGRFLPDMLTTTYTGMSYSPFGATSSTQFRAKKSEDGKTISWYHTDTSTKYSLNDNGVVYHYFAIG